MKALEINLENLIPTSSVFELKQYDNFEFKLRPCTGGMLVDMTEMLGNLEDLLGIPNAENISKIAMFLLEHSSAVKFKKQKVKIINTLTGDETEIDMGGYRVLMHSIRGINEQYNIYKAILLSLGYDEEKSNDMIKRLKEGINKLVNNEINNESKKKKIRTRKR